MSEIPTERVPLDDLIVLDEVQVRVDPLDASHAEQIALWLREHPDQDTEAIAVFKAGDEEGDDAGGHYVGGGFHRTEAYRLAGRKDIPCEIHPGGRRAAMMYSAADAGRNPTLAYSRADRRRAIEMVLRINPMWTDNRIAAFLKFTTNKTVCDVRAGLESTKEIPKCDVREDARGRMMPATTKPRGEPAPTPVDHASPSADFDPEQFDDRANDQPAAEPAPPRSTAPQRTPDEIIAERHGVDGLGNAIPRHLRDAFADESLAQAGVTLRRVASTLKSASNWNPFVPNISAELTRHAETVEVARPFAVCPNCKSGKGCAACMTKGFRPLYERGSFDAESDN